MKWTAKIFSVFGIKDKKDINSVKLNELNNKFDDKEEEKGVGGGIAFSDYSELPGYPIENIKRKIKQNTPSKIESIYDIPIVIKNLILIVKNIDENPNLISELELTREQKKVFKEITENDIKNYRSTSKSQDDIEILNKLLSDGTIKKLNEKGFDEAFFDTTKITGNWQRPS